MLYDDAYEDNIYANFFSKEGILKNLYIHRKTFKSENFLIQEGVAKINLGIGNIRVARIEAEKKLHEILDDSFIHYNPFSKEGHEKGVQKSTYVGGAYELLAEVNEVEKNMNKR
ncbi:hypothetical protein Fleli_0910 [Bernardetia litoralis DSM 6794]|uniref:Uncharacterized protein n=1 Tax=Bernardetia litoralis (strain ATCC 23117 / DSM 6794 / NBRC 15988 / NCIMB 1366 / Fx l1 / Sio-4) TaxID=880071 RepID=I4AHC9_BERLS|nr:hypothetical protein [Bernardetia litoralis]AFM03364.1 hypothetical protein Fleli_0910 [Bernardetia litoralis DSM 6794]